jgi:hypothetical protein
LCQADVRTRADEVLKLKSPSEKILRKRLRRPSRYVDRIVYWALADVTREAPRLGPSTTTSAPIFTRL